MGTVSVSDTRLLTDKSEVALGGLMCQGCASVIKEEDQVDSRLAVSFSTGVKIGLQHTSQFRANGHQPALEKLAVPHKQQTIREITSAMVNESASPKRNPVP